MSLTSNMLESTATIFRAVIGKDSYGGTTQSFRIIAEGVPCTFSQNQMGVEQLFAQRQDQTSEVIYLYGDSGAQVNDLAAITDLNAVTLFYRLDSHAKPSGRIPLRSFNATQINTPNGIGNAINTTVG